MVKATWEEIEAKMNLTMLTDFYEITMANGYFEHGLKDKIAYFDMFSVKCPMTAALH